MKISVEIPEWILERQRRYHFFDVPGQELDKVEPPKPREIRPPHLTPAQAQATQRPRFRLE